MGDGWLKWTDFNRILGGGTPHVIDSGCLASDCLDSPDLCKCQPAIGELAGPSLGDDDCHCAGRSWSGDGLDGGRSESLRSGAGEAGTDMRFVSEDSGKVYAGHALRSLLLGSRGRGANSKPDAVDTDEVATTASCARTPLPSVTSGLGTIADNNDAGDPLNDAGCESAASGNCQTAVAETAIENGDALAKQFCEFLIGDGPRYVRNGGESNPTLGHASHGATVHLSHNDRQETHSNNLAAKVSAMRCLDEGIATLRA